MLQEPEEYVKRCFVKFGKIQRKTTVLESLFNKVTDLEGLQLYLKRESYTGVSM